MCEDIEMHESTISRPFDHQPKKLKKKKIRLFLFF